jgi:hypothetical protein
MATTAVDAAARVATALDELAQALVTWSPEPVLRAEESLATAVAALRGFRAPAGSRPETAVIGDHDALRLAVEAARAGLDRCRALGRTATDFARLLRPEPAYSRTGAQLPAPAAPQRRVSVT